MVWWGWVVVLVAAVLLIAVAALAVQARRRSGTVIAVRQGRRSGSGGLR